MNVTFKEINQEFYFSEMIFSESGYKSITSKNAIFIGDFSGFKVESVVNKYRNNLSEIADGQLIEIYFHQKDKDNFYDNCNLLISTLKYINNKNKLLDTEIIIISDHYDYYYKELHSRIFLDTSTHNKFKASEIKILFNILIKNYFGYRISNFLRSCYYRVRRIIRY